MKNLFSFSTTKTEKYLCTKLVKTWFVLSLIWWAHHAIFVSVINLRLFFISWCIPCSQVSKLTWEKLYINLEKTLSFHVKLLRIPLQILVKLPTCFHEFFEYESTNFLYQVLSNIFSNAQNWKKKLFWPIRNLFSFSTRNIGQNFCIFVLPKFVKTCRELNWRRGICRHPANFRQINVAIKFWYCHGKWNIVTG